MSEGLNRAQLLGRLADDPELRHGRSGTAVLKLRLATNERIKRDGEWQEHTEWHSAVLFGRRAEALSDILRKGSMVMVEGPLRTSSWEGRDGAKRQATEVHADRVVLLGAAEGRQR